MTRQIYTIVAGAILLTTGPAFGKPECPGTEIPGIMQPEKQKQSKKVSGWWEKIREATANRKNDDSDIISVNASAYRNATETVAAPASKDTVSIALMLPFKSLSQHDGTSYCFYSGMLVAIDELGRDDIPIKLNVFDSEDGYFSITGATLNDNDILLGPIGMKEIKRIAYREHSGNYIVSPLDPAATDLTDSLRVIQAPLPPQVQMVQLAEWATKDCGPSDSLIVVNESSTNDQWVETIHESLNRSEAGYRALSCDTFEDLEKIFTGMASRTGTTRFLICSEREGFITRVVRVIADLARTGFSVSTYCPVKTRTFENLATTDKAAAEVRMIAGYHIDEHSEEARNFANVYRLLYKKEPSLFAYQGYDLTKCLVGLRKKFGPEWHHRIEGYKADGIQTKFHFTRKDWAVGIINEGSWKIRYTEDGKLVRTDF